MAQTRDQSEPRVVMWRAVTQTRDGDEIVHYEGDSRRIARREAGQHPEAYVQRWILEAGSDVPKITEYEV